MLQDLIRWILNLSHLKFPYDQKFPWPKPHVQKITMSKISHARKITCLKNSHAQNHMSKKKFPWPKSHVQKIPMTKITCPKFPCPRSHVQKIFHDQNHMIKNFPWQKKKKKIPWPKAHVQKILMCPKKSMSHKKKNQWPTKFYHNQNFWHVHTQLPKFSHNHAIKKIPTLTMSMYNRKNSYISKIITTQIFHDPTLHTQQKYFCSQNTISTKNFPYSYRKNFAINYTCQQIFHIYHDFVQPSLHNKFFMTSMPSDRPKMNWPLVIN